VSILSKAAFQGGAARAAYRIHRALRQIGVDSRMLVDVAPEDDWTVASPSHNWWRNGPALLRFVQSLLRRQRATTNPVIHSPAVMPSRWPSYLNASDADIIHLQWVNGEMLSIADIGKLEKPVVWTLHDMWPFCGAEHYTEEYRWQEGYGQSNRPGYESGFDLNKWTWNRKRKHWKKPVQLVAPSHWLAQCVSQSSLMQDWPVTVVPNAIDTEFWRPMERNQAREFLDLPKENSILLFGALGAGHDPRKGFDLLLEAIGYLRGERKDLRLVVFGQSKPKSPPDLGFPIHYFGHLHDDLSLRLLYCASDAMVIPSRLDNLPNTGLEALACSTPVVSFNVGGLPDIVVHKRSGYLAKAFDTQDLATGIAWVLDQSLVDLPGSVASTKYGWLEESARERAVAQFSYPVVAEQYLNVYRKI